MPPPGGPHPGVEEVGEGVDQVLGLMAAAAGQGERAAEDQRRPAAQPGRQSQYRKKGRYPEGRYRQRHNDDNKA